MAWDLPQLSYRRRVLVANNLIASMLWHRFTVLEPRDLLIKEIQRKLVDFFWTGQQWTRAAILYLPVHEGGWSCRGVHVRAVTQRSLCSAELCSEGCMAIGNSKALSLHPDRDPH
ncbi:hypothetical protein SRHO_G00078810 [Serrasalmus rhombeus]